MQYNIDRVVKNDYDVIRQMEEDNLDEYEGKNETEILTKMCKRYGYPMMEDKWTVSKANPVPVHIERPWYVGKRPQIFPSLDNKIKIHQGDEIKRIKIAAKVAARTLEHAME